MEDIVISLLLYKTIKYYINYTYIIIITIIIITYKYLYSIRFRSVIYNITYVYNTYVVI